MRHTIALVARNRPGVLHAISEALAEKGINIASIAAAETEDGGAASDSAYRESSEQIKRWHNRAQLRAVQHQIERTSDPEAVAQLLEEKQRLAQVKT